MQLLGFKLLVLSDEVSDEKIEEIFPDVEIACESDIREALGIIRENRPELFAKMNGKFLHTQLRKQVEQEIRNHPIWCSHDCGTFSPEAYRRARMIDGISAERVQDNYDLCHMFR